MADRSTRLTIRVLLDAAGAVGGMRELGNSTDGIGDKMKKLVAAGAAFAGVTAFVKTSVDAASRLQQSMGGVEAVFKGSAGTVKAWGAQAAQSVGLAQSEYQDLATLIGSQLKNAGTAMSELAPKTDGLIRQGADLAAMYGGTTADAVGALSSALKGERDPIEKYGISLTQAAIDAEIMAEGLDTSTSAAKQAATATATLALITKQSADAQGAAGREADSYASVMQRLSATWENTLAQIGTALLPALSGLGDAFTNLMPMVGAVITPIAELLGWVLQLPAPILAAAVAFGAWQVFGGSITRGLSTFTAQVRGATSSMAGLKSALGGIASSLAGGLAFAGLTIVIMSIAQAFQRVSEAAKTATAAYQPVVDALVASKGAWSDTAAAAQHSAILTSDAFKGLTEAGFSAADSVKILLGTQEEWIKVQSDGSDATRNLTKDTSAAVDGMIDANGAAAKLAQAQLDGMAAIEAQTGATQDNAAATQLSAAEQSKLAEEQGKAAIEAAKSAAAQTAVKVALDSVRTAASQAQTAIDYFVLSMQTAAGMNVTLDQAAKLMNDTLRSTASAFKDASDNGGINSAALTTWNVAALTATEQGSALYDSLIKQQTAYATSTTAAYNNASANGDTAAGMSAAAAAAQSAYDAFISMATGAGMGASEAEQLAAKLGIVQGTQLDPKTFELIAKDQQADQAVADLQAAQIAPKTVDVSANVAPATGAIDKAAGQSYMAKVIADANTQAATSQINTVAKAPYQATVVTQANVAPANSTVTQFTGQARDTTIQVQANTTGAQSAITALVTQSRVLTIRVDANTDPAAQAISRITGGSYSATINVSANVASAQAAIASVPRTVSVAPPPPAAAALGMSAYTAPATFAADAVAAPDVAYHAAPTLNLDSRSLGAAGGSVTYNVEITGHVKDPDGAARAIEKLLASRARRSTTVIAR
jgi:hypothetical protein